MNPARLVQSIGWMAFLALLLLGGGYTSYIADWQHWVLVSATALFAGLVLVDALLNRGAHDHDHEHHDHDHGTATDQWVQTLVHLLPLFLALTLGVTTLGSQAITSFQRPTSYAGQTVPSAATPMVSTTPPGPAASPRAATITPVAVTTPAAADVPPATSTDAVSASAAQTFADGPTPPEPSAPLPPAPQPAAALVPAVPLTLLELYFPKKHPGVTRIETIGRLMIPTAEELKNAPPEMDRADLRFLLYRHVMTCCAADASPVFVVLRGHDPDGLKIDEWVRVTGTWVAAPALGDMAKIVVDGLAVIAAPKDPFLQAPKD